jgi:hypothetical protein
MATTEADNRFTRQCRIAVLCLLLLLPALRLVEGVGRLIFMPSFYDSFWHAITAEMWFTPLWWLYTNTLWGRLVMCVLIFWIAAIPVIVILPVVPLRKTICTYVSILCVMIIAVNSFRLESFWNGRSESEWVWCLRSRDPELRRQAALGLRGCLFKFGFPQGTILLAKQGLNDEVPEVRQFAETFFARHSSAVAEP